MALSIGTCLLRRHLKRIGMTQAELAQRTGLTESMISHYVHSRHKMTLEAAVNISRVIGCEPQELYEWKVIRNRPE